MRRTVLLLVVTTGALFGCRPEPGIGLLQPLTGRAAAYGQSVDRGAQVALAEAQDEGWLPDGFRLHQEDTGSNPARAVELYRRMTDEGQVGMVVGGVTTAEASALMPELERARVVCVSPTATATGLTRRSQYFFRVYPSDQLEGQTAARYLIEGRGVRRLILYTDGAQFTRSMEAEFRQYYQLALRGRILATVHLNEPGWEQRSVDMLAAHRPQGVYVVGYGERIVEVLEHLHAKGFEGVRSTASTLFLGELLQQHAELVEDVVFPLVVYEDGRDTSGSFVERFQASYDRDPDVFAAHGYDAMRLVLHALRAGRVPSPQELARTLRFGLDDLRGATGFLAFDDHGDVKHYPVMHRVADGWVVPIRRG